MTGFIPCDASATERAQASIVNPATGLHVTLCGHHLNRFRDTLEAQGFTHTAPATDDLGLLDFVLEAAR